MFLSLEIFQEVQIRNKEYKFNSITQKSLGFVTALYHLGAWQTEVYLCADKDQRKEALRNILQKYKRYNYCRIFIASHSIPDIPEVLSYREFRRIFTDAQTKTVVNHLKPKRKSKKLFYKVTPKATHEVTHEAMRGATQGTTQSATQKAPHQEPKEEERPIGYIRLNAYLTGISLLELHNVCSILVKKNITNERLTQAMQKKAEGIVQMIIDFITRRKEDRTYSKQLVDFVNFQEAFAKELGIKLPK